MKDHVWVEVDNSWGMARVIRIFKSERAANRYHNGAMILLPYEEAVASIRRQIFYRSKGFCELCGVIVLETSGHMHEQTHRGKGGEISLANSVFICPACHKHAHSDREPKFTRRPQ